MKKHWVSYFGVFFYFSLEKFFANKFSNVPNKILLVFIFVIFSLIFALIFHFHSLNYYHFGILFLEFNHPFSFDVNNFYRVSKVSYLLHIFAVYLYIQTYMPISLFLSTGKKKHPRPQTSASNSWRSFISSY